MHMAEAMTDAVTPIRDGAFAFDPRLYADVRAAPAEAARLLGQTALPEAIDLPVWAYLITSPDGPCLVDAGGGALMDAGFGALPVELERLGIASADIVRVYLTHLHGDHCGGLIDARGAAAFPNARIAVPDAEITFWLEADRPDGLQPIVADARRAIAAQDGRIDRVQPGESIGAAVAVDARGHTPGHTAWLFEDAQALACGDMLHVRDLALAHPDWSTDWDMDPSQSAATRLALMRRAAQEGLTLLTCHGGPIAPADIPQPDDAVSA